jgi:hypothetical protein
MAKRYNTYTNEELKTELVLAFDAAKESDEAFACTGKAWWRMQRRTRWKRYIGLKKEAEQRWRTKFPFLKDKRTLELYLERVKT